ncbi:ketosteroid isomerase-like protein [Variovorax sp. TBS-050B]|uniref:nuclear transport factor 2 family protein n=1 Tax=Variovorax sp. TBS-050B TaxID=2940551 RepID=UPI0024732319|nr:nuclear transport factor 2 family protein [Variovorax sp. TBS-050B]MDH6590415.1 ketosteroid isomerase-like protein [Variovorax sp. TBS-050B]
MSEISTKGRELYAALNSGDADALARLLRDDFSGCLSPGLPRGLGKTYGGLNAMMGEAWAVVDQLFDLDVEVDQLFEAGDMLIARGMYHGTAKQSGKAFRAAFAHFWHYDGTQFSQLQQITDTGLWRDAIE